MKLKITKVICHNFAFFPYNVCCCEIENEINLGPTAVTTDIERYMHILMDCYNDGFTLAKFVRIPDIHSSTDLTWTSREPYQAILTRENFIGYTFFLLGICVVFTCLCRKLTITYNVRFFCRVTSTMLVLTRDCQL